MNVSRMMIFIAAGLTGTVSMVAGQASRPPSRDIAQTPHNLSISGGGGAHDIKSLTESRICIFCHTPHHAASVTPLWSREVSALTIYVPYRSSTIKANPQQPMGASRLCLSCHDGTIALGHLNGGMVLDASLPALRDIQERDPQKNSNLGTDLSDDHPISFSYPFGVNLELNDPLTLQARGIKLQQGQYVECTSCHDPHNNQYGSFLVKDTRTQHDALCTECHNKDGWNDTGSDHRTGGSRYPTVASTVAADGCASCHRPHNAEKPEHLLKLSQPGAGEETTCYLSCHRDAPYSNVWSAFNTTLYRHPVQNSADIHASNEALPLTAARKHVECTDCHNPHRAGAQGFPMGDPFPVIGPASTAPDVNGPLKGVRGVDQTGAAAVAVARYEYEICYRCHAGASAEYFTSLATQLPARQFTAYDESERFNPANPSFHPLVADRKGTGRSLLTQYQNKMQRIYCNDCHEPHGSNEPHMLRAQNCDTFPAIASTYPLCYRCHDEFYLMNTASSAALHRSHVLEHTRRAPCSACHDPHGTPVIAGATAGNAAHLVNFDKLYAGSGITGSAYNAMTRTCLVAGTCHTGTQPYPAY